MSSRTHKPDRDPRGQARSGRSRGSDRPRTDGGRVKAGQVKAGGAGAGRADAGHGPRGGGRRRSRGRPAVAASPKPPFQLLTLGLLLLGLPWIAALPAFPPGDGMSGGVAVGLWVAAATIGVLAGFMWRAWDLMALPVLAGGALVGAFMVQADRTAKDGVMEAVAAADLPVAPISDFYHVEDGRLKPQFSGLALTTPKPTPDAPAIGRVPIGYCVTPLVGAGWRPTLPVPAWAVGYREGDTADWPLARSACPAWRRDNRVVQRPQAYAVFAIAPDGIAAAIRDSIARHGLHTPDEAPILFPRDDISSGFASERLIPLAAGGLLQLVGLVWMGVAYRRRRQQGRLMPGG